MRKKQWISIICSILMMASILTGCESTADDGKNDGIELLAPIGVSEKYEYAKERDMYSVDIYSSSVNPVVTEYSFKKEQTFQSYGAVPGETVEEGTVLVYSETKSLDEEKQSIDEEIDDLVNNHQIEATRLEKDLIDAKKAEEEALESYNKIARVEPEPCTPQHDAWEDQVRWPEYSYKNSIQRREKIEDSIRQNNELYQVDYDYLLGKKKRINEKVEDSTVVSDTAGEIVACNYFENGDLLSKEVPVLAVGDTSTKVLQTDYISKGTINKALDVYAIIDGKRYEIEYVNMEPEEYQQLVDEEESVHTTFILQDPSEEISIGTYAVVVIEKDRRRKVLCIPDDALKKESDGYYVYLFDGEESKYVPVEVGMRDGQYAEIISGLKSGDKVLTDNLPKKGKNTAEVTRQDYFIETELKGYLYYPFSEWMSNPAENGETYLKEILVSENERVNQDQVLAIIEVVPDKIEVARLSTQISRLEARHAEMALTKAACDAKGLVSYELNIKISENERDTKIKRRALAKINKYSGEIEIKAPYDGVVMQVENIKPGELLAPEAHIVEMANDSTSYIIVKDDKNQLNYGNMADVTVSGTSGPVTISGKVVTVNNNSLTKKLSSEYSLIAVAQEEMDNIAGSVMINPGTWYRNDFKVKVKVRSEKNVLMIPKAAVTAKDKSTYVTVVNNDGSVDKKSFIAGGSDNNYYWVVDGLTEGMTICWE